MARGLFAGTTFGTQQEYQNALARAKGFTSYAALRRSPTKVIPKDFGKLAPQSQEAWRRAHRAVADVARGIPLDQAARQNAVAPETVQRYAGDSLQRLGRRYAVKESAQRHQWVHLYSERGRIEIAVPDRAERSLIASYMNAVREWANGASDDILRPYEGKSVRDASGKRYPLITNPRILRELAAAGELSFDSLYLFE
jgi:hypothetical protein